jgi:hypothetical protein
MVDKIKKEDLIKKIQQDDIHRTYSNYGVTPTTPGIKDVKEYTVKDFDYNTRKDIYVKVKDSYDHALGIGTIEYTHPATGKKQLLNYAGENNAFFNNRLKTLREDPSIKKKIANKEMFAESLQRKSKEFADAAKGGIEYSNYADLNLNNLAEKMAEERPYIPTKELYGTDKFLEDRKIKEILGNVAKKWGYKGLKMLPWVGMGASIASGDVMGAVPGIGDLLSSEDVGQGSDQVPYQMKYTPMPVLPGWLGIGQ